jgi:hypothetical protein
MANYLLAYHGGGMPQSEEELARVTAAWEKWYGELGPAVFDPGNPVGQARTVGAGGAVTAGGGANPVSGYTVLKADSLDAAVSMARGCPILGSGGTIEVCETIETM